MQINPAQRTVRGAFGPSHPYPGPAPTLSKHTHARANSSSRHLDFGIKGLRPKAKRRSARERVWASAAPIDIVLDKWLMANGLSTHTRACD